MYIDLNLGLRRIFFPVVHKWDVQDVDDYCMGVQIYFAVHDEQRKVQVYDINDNPTEAWVTLESSGKGWGIDYQYSYTLAFDPYDIITYLTTPENMRDPSISVWKLMRLYEASNVLSTFNPSPNQKRVLSDLSGDSYNYATQFYLDAADFLSDENNLQLMYKENDQRSAIVKAVLDFIGTGLSFIPLFGPLVSTSYHYIVEAVAYPDDLKRFGWAEALQEGGTMTGKAVWDCTKYMSEESKTDLSNAANDLKESE